MPITPTVTFRGLHRSPQLESAIRLHATKLERYGPPIMSCRVLVERVGRRRESGNPIHVALDLTVPAGEIVVSREATMHARVAIRDAFESARRRLQDFARRQRGDVKRHEPAPRTRRRAVSVKPEARLLPAANK